MFQNLVDIIAAPNAVFTRLKDRPTILLPLLLVCTGMVSMQLGYIYLSDFNFMIEQIIEQALASNPNARESEIRAAMSNLSPTVLAVSSGVSTLVILLLLNVIYAGYLNFVAKFGATELGFRHWFSLMNWTSIPVLLVALAGWVVILSSPNGMIEQQALQPLSIDALLALNSSSTMLQNLSLPQLWALGLLVCGYRAYTGSSWLKAAIIALLPSVLIYGIWGLVTML